jgi:hypothetical protein
VDVEGTQPPPRPPLAAISTAIHPKPTTRSSAVQSKEMAEGRPTSRHEKGGNSSKSDSQPKAATASLKLGKDVQIVDDSCPYSLVATVSGMSEVPVTVAEHSPKTLKMTGNTGEEEEVLAGQAEEPPSKVRSEGRRVIDRPPNARKLVVFNVHGTLLDSNLIAERNPNSDIQATLTTDTRKLIFRPWLIEFLSRCFKNFEVGFWGSKMELYMKAVVDAMLGRMKDTKACTPLFVWSAKECEVTSFEDGIPLTWGKPLAKVFKTYPSFNRSNTVIVDHKSWRLEGNPAANIIKPTAFYVADINGLGDDKGFLKVSLWPQLQSLYGSENIRQFRLKYPNSVLDASVKVSELCRSESTTASAETVEGEGTCTCCTLHKALSPHLV